MAYWGIEIQQRALINIVIGDPQKNKCKHLWFSRTFCETFSRAMLLSFHILSLKTICILNLYLICKAHYSTILSLFTQTKLRVLLQSFDKYKVLCSKLIPFWMLLPIKNLRLKNVSTIILAFSVVIWLTCNDHGNWIWSKSRFWKHGRSRAESGSIMCGWTW